MSRLSEMLNNGFTLADAIEFLGKIDKRSNQKMLNELQNGTPMHEVLYQEQYDKKACTQIFFADKHGNIANALSEAGQYLLKKNNDRKTLFKLMQYPIILIFLLALVLVILKKFLLPQFVLLYDSMNYRPTTTIHLIIKLMENMHLYFACFLAVSLLLTLCIFLQSYKKSPIQKAERIAKIPVVRFYFRLLNSQFLAREWGFLLSSGFSINEVLEFMGSQSFRPLLSDAAKIIRKDLTLGHSFSDSLSKLSFLDKQFITVIKHGEKNGRLDQELQYYSRFCLVEIEEQIQKVFQYLQPLMFILIGFLVVAIYLSILLPMFEMIDSI